MRGLRCLTPSRGGTGADVEEAFTAMVRGVDFYMSELTTLAI